MVSASVDHCSDEPLQFDRGQKGAKSRAPFHRWTACLAFAWREFVALGSAGIHVIHLILAGSDGLSPF
jgi:hypothetical protein